jgi:hypothetical protein
MRFTVIFAFVLLTLAIGCNKKVSPEEAPVPADPTMKMVAFDEVVGLALGEMAKVEKTAAGIKFLSVASDNRCPKDVNCITEGEAFVMVSLAGGNAQRVRIDVDPKRMSRMSMEGATVEFLSLDPYPQSRVKIDPADIRLRVRIIKSAKM